MSSQHNKVYHRNETYYGRTTTILLGDAAAYAMVTMFNNNSGVAVIHDLVVLKERRGEGLGREMLEEACEEAKRMGADYIRLAVEPESWLEEWYKRHGFENAGTLIQEGLTFNVLEKPGKEQNDEKDS